MSVNWTRDAAAHLLRRAGFGGTPAEIDSLFARGHDGAVSYLVDYDSIDTSAYEASLVAKNYAKIVAGETIRLFKSHRDDVADGEQSRDFVYVKDCAAAMLWLWRQLPASGIYNLGTGAASSFRALMEATGAVCGGPPKIEYVDTPEAIRPNYQYKTEAKMERLRALGYNAPFTPLEEAVEDFAVNYLANPDPYL